MLPLDVSNSRDNGLGGLDMKSFWFFIYMIILAMVVVFLPFAQFFYETDEEKSMVINGNLKINYFLVIKMLPCYLLIIMLYNYSLFAAFYILCFFALCRYPCFSSLKRIQSRYL